MGRDAISASGARSESDLSFSFTTAKPPDRPAAIDPYLALAAGALLIIALAIAFFAVAAKSDSSRSRRKKES